MKINQILKEDAEPMDREFALVKKLGRLGERIVQNPRLWDRYDAAIDNDDTDWIIGLIQDGTGATASEVLKLADLFGEIGGGLGRIIDFAWAVKQGTWDKDFMNPYRAHRSQGLAEFSFDKDGGDDGAGDDPYKYPQPEHYDRSIDFFGRFEADHFDDEEFDKATGVFKGYWNDQEGRDQIAYFKFDNPRRTGDDDPGMGWYYEPQNESVVEGPDDSDDYYSLPQPYGDREEEFPMAQDTGFDVDDEAEDQHGLNEFAPDSGDDGEPDEEILRKLAAQWWSGTEQQMARAQQTLEALGWEIGPDESGDEDAGVYVYRIGDDDGRDTIAFGHSELSLDEGVTEMDSQGYTGSRDRKKTSKYGSRDHYDLGGPESTGRPLTAKQMMDRAHKEMMKSMSNDEKVDKGWRNPNIDEGAGNIGSAIKSLYQKIYNAGDDEVEYFYNDSPIFAQYWDEYEGDLDSIIAEVDPEELEVIKAELESYVDDANLAEGFVSYNQSLQAVSTQTEQELEQALNELLEAVATTQPAAPATTQQPAATAPAPTTPAAPAPTTPAAPAKPTVDPVQQKADDMEQKLLDRMGARFGLPPGSSMEQVEAAQQAYLDKNDPKAAAQYKQNMANIDAGNTAANKPVELAPKPAPAAAPTQQPAAAPTQDADFNAGLAAQKAGASPVEIMLAQPTIAGNQSLLDAIAPSLGLPAGSTADQLKAAAKQKYGGAKQPAPAAAPAAPVAESKPKEREADYGADYQDMVARVKKLAGLGPLKTVYDPQKRVYKNVPQAVQPKK